MGGEDALLGRVKPTPRPHRHFVNVHPTPSHATKHDANSELQKSDPEHYGPYLEEGERYNKPRSHENVEAACEAMGLNALADEDKDERPFYRQLIYDHWVLIDDKLRAIKGVEVDIDLRDVKPAAAAGVAQRSSSEWRGRVGIKPEKDDSESTMRKRALALYHSMPASSYMAPMSTSSSQ